MSTVAAAFDQTLVSYSDPRRMKKGHINIGSKTLRFRDINTFCISTSLHKQISHAELRRLRNNTFSNGAAEIDQK